MPLTDLEDIDQIKEIGARKVPRSNRMMTGSNGHALVVQDDRDEYLGLTKEGGEYRVFVRKR